MFNLYYVQINHSTLILLKRLNYIFLFHKQTVKLLGIKFNFMLLSKDDV